LYFIKYTPYQKTFQTEVVDLKYDLYFMLCTKFCTMAILEKIDNIQFGLHVNLGFY